MANPSVGVHTKVTGSAISGTTPGVNTTTGSALGIIVNWSSAQSIQRIEDNKGNTNFEPVWNEVNSNGHKSAAFRLKNIAGGTGHTVTVGFSASTVFTIYFCEILDASPTVPYDSSTPPVVDTASPFTLGLTTANPNTVILGFFGGDSGSNPATHAETGLGSSTIQEEELDAATRWASCIVTAVKSSQGTYTLSGTESGSSNAHVHLMAFKGSIAPDIMVQPQSGAALVDETVTFTYTRVTSSGSITDQAQTSLDGQSWSNVSGAGSTSYTTPALTQADNGRWYRFQFTDGNGTSTSEPVRAWVRNLPSTGEGRRL